MKKLLILLAFVIAASMTSFAYNLRLRCTVDQIYVFSTVLQPGNPFYIELYAQKAGVATGEDDQAFAGFAAYDTGENLLLQRVAVASKAYERKRLNLTVRNRNIYRLELYLHANRSGDFATSYLRW